MKRFEKAEALLESAEAELGSRSEARGEQLGISGEWADGLVTDKTEKSTGSIWVWVTEASVKGTLADFPKTGNMLQAGKLGEKQRHRVRGRNRETNTRLSEPRYHNCGHNELAHNNSQTLSLKNTATIKGFTRGVEASSCRAAQTS